MGDQQDLALGASATVEEEPEPMKTCVLMVEQKGKCNVQPACEMCPMATSQGRRWETDESRGEAAEWEEECRDPVLCPGKLRRGLPKTSMALPPAGLSALNK